jgi:hypothetical protein
VTTQRVTPTDFMKASPAPLSGNTAYASRYARELKQVFLDHAARSPRTLQQHLGPSELGVSCDRQVAGKFAALPTTNHVSDPWPSIVGTACHAWAADAFDAENIRRNVLRWVTEYGVTPHPDHPGTADLYDAQEWNVVDHKFLGESSMAKVRKRPPRKYRVQLHLYSRGYINLGLPVQRAVLAAYPRTAGSLDGLYVWEEATNTPDSNALLQLVFDQTAVRRYYGAEIVAGRATLLDIPADTGEDGSDECYFCPFYRPQATDGLGGCPGPDK